MPAKYVYSLDNSQPMTQDIVTNADVVSGDLLAITSGLVGPATAADSGIVGVAMNAVSSGGVCRVLLLNPNSVIRVPFAGTSKTELAAADRFGTAYDWDATAKGMNLDDTTDGYLKVVNYNNTTGLADVVIKASALWNA